MLNQLWHLEAARLGADTHMKTIGIGVSGGYYAHLGDHFYVYPNAALTYDATYAGDPAVQGRAYEVSPVGFAE